MRWFLYAARCRGDSLYAGVTTDLGRRMAEHNEGHRGARYTRSRRPVALAGSWGPFDKVTAHRLEYRFKKLSRGQKVDALKLGADDLVELLLQVVR